MKLPPRLRDAFAPPAASAPSIALAESRAEEGAPLSAVPGGSAATSDAAVPGGSGAAAAGFADSGALTPDALQSRAFYHFDALGSTVNLTDDAGAVTEAYLYYAWGNFRETDDGAAAAAGLKTANGFTPTGSATAACEDDPDLGPDGLYAWETYLGNVQSFFATDPNRLTYTGHEFDPETGLYYAQARFYDPEIGRFDSEDPALGKTENPPSLHRYFYAAANPLRYSDPSGREIKTNTIDRFRNMSREDAPPTDLGAAAFVNDKLRDKDGDGYIDHFTLTAAEREQYPDLAITEEMVNSKHIYIYLEGHRIETGNGWRDSRSYGRPEYGGMESVINFNDPRYRHGKTEDDLPPKYGPAQWPAGYVPDPAQLEPDGTVRVSAVIALDPNMPKVDIRVGQVVSTNSLARHELKEHQITVERGIAYGDQQYPSRADKERWRRQIARYYQSNRRTDTGGYNFPFDPSDQPPAFPQVGGDLGAHGLSWTNEIKIKSSRPWLRDGVEGGEGGEGGSMLNSPTRWQPMINAGRGSIDRISAYQEIREAEGTRQKVLDHLAAEDQERENEKTLREFFSLPEPDYDWLVK